MNVPAVRWSIPQRLARAVFALPPGLLARCLGPAVERDGRVLDRTIQLLLALGERSGRTQRELAVEPMRKQLRQLSGFAMPKVAGIEARDQRIDGPGGPIPIRIYRAPGTRTPTPAVVYFHGGGWVCGGLESHDSSCRLLAAVAGCSVVAVDYRLAPEHPHPAATDDALCAWRWAVAHARELGLDARRIAVMGDSAGGNLAAAVCLAARDSGLPLPAAQGLVYPAVDMVFGAASHASVGVGFGLERRTMEWFRAQYAADPSLWRTPLVSPLHAPDHSGLPPALIVTAGFDPLRDEGDAYAAALEGAGVAVRHLRYDDTIHGFFGMGLIPGGMARATEVCAAMGELIGRD